MHCESCEIIIKDELSELAGVSEVTIDHKTGKGTLILDESKNSTNDVLKAVSKAGYTAIIDAIHDMNKEKDKNREWK